ncbi:MAG: hypothetical protein Q9213_003250, partial [Squamulea squamosa]
LKLIIAGNHDLELDKTYWDTKTAAAQQTVDDPDDHSRAVEIMTGELARKAGVTYLTEGTYEFTLRSGATFKIYVSPYTPEFYDWSHAYLRNEDRFNLPEDVEKGCSSSSSSSSISVATNPIPGDVDIVMTHGPPRGILDQSAGGNVGCNNLMQAIRRVKPMVHCFGHIHEGSGVEVVDWKVREGKEVAKELGGKRKNEAVHRFFEEDQIENPYREVFEWREGKEWMRGETTLAVNGSIMGGRYKPMNAPWRIRVDLKRATTQAREQEGTGDNTLASRLLGELSVYSTVEKGSRDLDNSGKDLRKHPETCTYQKPDMPYNLRDLDDDIQMVPRRPRGRYNRGRIERYREATYLGYLDTRCTILEDRIRELEDRLEEEETAHWDLAQQLDAEREYNSQLKDDLIVDGAELCRLRDENRDLKDKNKMNPRSLNELLRLKSRITQGQFVVVLIDADGYKFLSQYLQADDERGGKLVSDELFTAVKTHLSIELGETNNCEVFVRAYANLTDLGAACQREQRTDDADLGRFVRGFNSRRPFFDFVDVGPGKERAEQKIRGLLNHYIHSPQCKHVFLALSHDSGYVPFLEPFAGEGPVKDRITLIYGSKVDPAIKRLGFKAILLPSVFSATFGTLTQEETTWRQYKGVDDTRGRQEPGHMWGVQNTEGANQLVTGQEMDGRKIWSVLESDLRKWRRLVGANGTPTEAWKWKSEEGLWGSLELMIPARLRLKAKESVVKPGKWWEEEDIYLKLTET